MQIEVSDNRAAQRFEATADRRPAAFIDYRLSQGRISLIHTQVDDGFEGKGVASVLVKRALGMVRDAQLEMLPVCQFVRTYVQRHPEYLDLVPEDERARFELEQTTPPG